MTFASTALAVIYNNLEPVFVDSDYETMCISIDDLKCKAKDASAVIIVHFGGEMCDMQEIKNICDENSLSLVEDCAHTQGGTIDGRAMGTFGDIGCFHLKRKKA